MAAGSRLEDRPVYAKGTCFDPFPFPDPDEFTKQRIRNIAEQLDAHRKRQQEQHSALTITGMYNVLEKLRSGEALTPKEKKIHEQGLVSVLKAIHDELDAAVFDAYGWPHHLSDEDILERLVALNAERTAEERRGIVRWLRPGFQNPSGTATSSQTTITLGEAAPAAEAAASELPEWPKELRDQVSAVRNLITASQRDRASWTRSRGNPRLPRRPPPRSRLRPRSPLLPRHPPLLRHPQRPPLARRVSALAPAARRYSQRAAGSALVAHYRSH